MATILHTSGSVQGVQLLGRICFWAGVLGAASGIFLAVYPADVEPDRYSYPLTAMAFAAIQVWFFVQHLGLIAGLEAVRRLSAGRSRLGLAVAIAGLALLSVVELLAISAAGTTESSSLAGLLGALYGISTILAGLGPIYAGLVANGPWFASPLRRLLLLATGAYVFVPMFPALTAGFLAPGSRLLAGCCCSQPSAGCWRVLLLRLRCNRGSEAQTVRAPELRSPHERPFETMSNGELGQHAHRVDD